MISFYKDETGVVVYLDDTYLQIEKFAIGRRARQGDIDAHPDEHAAFLAPVALTDLAPAEVSPAAVAVSE